MTSDKSCSDELFWCMELQIVDVQVRHAAANLLENPLCTVNACIGDSVAPLLRDGGSRGCEGQTSARKCEERCVEVQPKRLSLSGDPKVPPPVFGEGNGGVSCGAALGEWRLMPRDLPALTSLAISGDLFLFILRPCALTLSIGLSPCLSLRKASSFAVSQ